MSPGRPRSRGGHAYRALGFAVLIVGNALILGGVLAQSFNGRQDIITASRHACRLRAGDYARLANIDRDQQRLDEQLAAPSVIGSPRLRALLHRTAVGENLALHALDRHIDRSGWRFLNPVGLRYVRSLRHPYSCTLAFPNATFRFF